MDTKFMKLCDLENVKAKEVATGKSKPENEFDLLPCQRKFRLLPEDEISVDSILSAIVSKVIPSSEELKDLKWNVKAKDMLNAKQSMIFEEKLYISNLNQTNCFLSEEHKILLERDLKEVGYYNLNIEESYDGFVIFSNSKMKKGVKNTICGHDLRGKYDDYFVLIAEKRTEFDYIDNARIEKTMNARIIDNNLIIKRETRINEDAQKFKATVNMKGREELFVLDGGVQMLMRYLIINNFRGELKYYSMNLYGRIIECILKIYMERKTVKIFKNTYERVILVENTQYFDHIPQENSQTYFSLNGRILLHFWNGYNYILHSVRATKPIKEKILPKLELMWKTDPLLMKNYKETKKMKYREAFTFLSKRPDISDFIQDYILVLLRHKPSNILEFTIKFCQNTKRNY